MKELSEIPEHFSSHDERMKGIAKANILNYPERDRFINGKHNKSTRLVDAESKLLSKILTWFSLDPQYGDQTVKSKVGPTKIGKRVNRVILTLAAKWKSGHPIQAAKAVKLARQEDNRRIDSRGVDTVCILNNINLLLLSKEINDMSMSPAQVESIEVISQIGDTHTIDTYTGFYSSIYNLSSNDQGDRPEEEPEELSKRFKTLAERLVDLHRPSSNSSNSPLTLDETSDDEELLHDALEKQSEGASPLVDRPFKRSNQMENLHLSEL